MINEIAQTFWLLLPIYCANAAPVIFKELIKRFPHPIDFNYKINGKRLFGDGKTWAGLFIGIVMAGLVGLIQSFFTFNPKITVSIAVWIGFGALIGDVISSFFKRQLNMEQGDKLPLVDQLDFILGAFIFMIPIGLFNLTYFIIAIIVTPVIHFTSNMVAHRIGLKDRPW